MIGAGIEKHVAHEVELVLDEKTGQVNLLCKDCEELVAEFPEAIPVDLGGGVPSYAMEQGETAFLGLGVIVAKYYRKLLAQGTPDALATELAVNFQTSLFSMIGQNSGG